MFNIFADAHMDLEQKHVQANLLLCEVLKSYGYEVGVSIFENAEKWYA